MNKVITGLAAAGLICAVSPSTAASAGCAQPTKIVLDEDGHRFQLYSYIDNRVAG